MRKQTCFNPYAGLNHPMAPYHYHHQRRYTHDDYDAARDMNNTTRTVVAGAVTIGAIGLMGGLLGGMMR